MSKASAHVFTKIMRNHKKLISVFIQVLGSHMHICFLSSVTVGGTGALIQFIHHRIWFISTRSDCRMSGSEFCLSNF